VGELRVASSAHLLPRALLGLAMLEAGAGQDRRAAQLLGAFDASGAHAAGWPLEGYHLGPDPATLRAGLAPEPLAAAIVVGRTLTVDQALDEALADAPDSFGSDPLNAREHEVAALLAAGHTNH
jgi:hypothetical protein